MKLSWKALVGVSLVMILIIGIIKSYGISS
jgi:hypothetical protein